MSEYLGPFCAFLAAAAWAIAVTVYSKLSRVYPPSALNFTRAFISFPIFVLLVIATQHGVAGAWHHLLTLPGNQLAWLFIGMIASFAVGDVLFLVASTKIGVPSALAIASTYPVWSALIGFLFLGQTLTLQKGIGVLTVVSGAILVILAGARQNSHQNTNPIDGGVRANAGTYSLGISLSFLASFFWCLNAYSVSVGGKNMPTETINAIRMFLAIVLCPWTGWIGYRTMKVLLPLKEIRTYWWIFLIEAVGGTYAYVYGLVHSPLAIGATLSSLAPVLSAPIVWVLGYEKPSIAKFTGLVMVVAGAYLLF